MRGVTTHIYAPKSNTNCTTALKKNPDTRVLSPSLIRMLVILLNTDCVFFRLRITTSQSSSATDISLSWYLREELSQGCAHKC